MLELFSLVIERVRFEKEADLSIGSWLRAYQLCRDIDENDVPFVALTLDKSAQFWTNDLKLRIHLERNGFTHFYEPSEVIELNEQ